MEILASASIVEYRSDGAASKTLMVEETSGAINLRNEETLRMTKAGSDVQEASKKADSVQAPRIVALDGSARRQQQQPPAAEVEPSCHDDDTDGIEQGNRVRVVPRDEAKTDEATSAVAPAQVEQDDFGEEYSVVIPNPGSQGLCVDTMETESGFLQITNIAPGPVQAWNRSNCKGAQVRDTDVLLRVNKQTGSPRELLNQISTSPLPTLALHLRRATEFTVRIMKRTKGDQLALDIGRTCESSLLVAKVRQGAVLEWNQAHPKEAVVPGDRIVGVNGVRGSSAEFMRLIASELRLDLRISRIVTG